MTIEFFFKGEDDVHVRGARGVKDRAVGVEIVEVFMTFEDVVGAVEQDNGVRFISTSEDNRRVLQKVAECSTLRLGEIFVGIEGGGGEEVGRTVPQLLSRVGGERGIVSGTDEALKAKFNRRHKLNVVDGRRRGRETERPC